MHKITSKERRKAGNIYCDHCKPIRVNATWRKSGFADHKQGDFACEIHKDLIQDYSDSHITEADFQTWHRL